MASFYGGSMGSGSGPGSPTQSQMLSFSSCLLALISVAVVGIMMTRPSSASNQNPNPNQNQNPPQTSQLMYASSPQPPAPNLVPGVASVPQPPPNVARGLDGRWAITYGSLGLRVDPKECQVTNVWFDEATESSLNAWNLETVPGYEDVYFIRSEERAFDKACDRAYLTSPEACTGTLTMARPENTERQLWQLVPSRDGGYEIRNVACTKKRWPSYMISSGKQGGVTNTARLAPRDGSSYVLRRQQG